MNTAVKLKSHVNLTYEIVRKDTSILTKTERAALPHFVNLLKNTTRGPKTAITLGYFVDSYNKKSQKKISDSMGMRIIRHIRVNGIVKRLMADRYGYFVAEDLKSYRRYLEILNRRIKSQTKTYTALKNQI